MARKMINKVILRRTSDKMVREIDRIKIKRVKNELDRKMCYDSEVTEMMVNAPSWPKVRRELETMPKMEDLR